MFKRKWTERSLVGALFLGALVVLSISYYAAFAQELSYYDGERGFFQYALNDHDHHIYAEYIDIVRSREFLYEMNNDFGIATIYSFLSTANAPGSDPDYTLTALIFNLVAMVWCYLLYSSICEKLQLGLSGRLSFFANASLIYFAQLINKDMLTIAAFLFCVNSTLKGRIVPIIIIIPFLALVRQQLALFAIIFIYLMQPQRPSKRILFAYIVTSTVAGFLSVFASIIGEETLGNGLSLYLVDFNSKYYVGYLLFNPIRVIQYIYDAYSSFSFETLTGGVDTAKVLRLPQLILVAALAKPISSMVIRFQYWMDSPAKSLVIATTAYLLTWLMNPTVNARYVMLITPVLVLFGLYARKRINEKIPA